MVLNKSEILGRSILLLGGLDDRGGDLSISQQVKLLEEGTSNSMKVVGFRHFEDEALVKSIKQSTKQMYVVLFSSSARYSQVIGKLFSEKGYNLKNIFIVEPYGKSKAVTSLVNQAVEMGVPSSNVIVGKTESTGLDIVKNATPVPECTPTHWCGLGEVGKIIQINQKQRFFIIGGGVALLGVALIIYIVKTR